MPTTDPGFYQGDPISPYLFVLTMEIYGSLLEKALADKDFTLSLLLTQKVNIPHFCCADEVLIICRGDSKCEYAIYLSSDFI